METQALTCRKCSAAMEPGEEFCSACGTSRAQLVPSQDPPPPTVVDLYPAAPGEAAAKARKWLMIIALITLVSGVIMWVIQKGEVEKTFQELDAQIGHLSPDERDAVVKENTGMTYQEVIDHDRGMVTMILVVNVGLALFYFGMWLWAKKNALAASVVSLLMFISVHAINAVLDPTSLYKGIIIKVLFVLALVKAIQLAQEERRARGV